MAWGRCDDSFYDHPKVRRIPRRVRNEAAGLFWRAISLCNRHLTDGRIHSWDLEAIDARRAAVDQLVEVGLWERRGEMYQVHDFHDFNKSADEIIEERGKRAAAGRAGGLASARSRAKPSVDSEANDEASASPIVERPLNPRPVPSRPVPLASTEASPPTPREDAAQAYYSVRGGQVSHKAIAFVDDIAGEFGEEATAAEIGRQAKLGPVDNEFLSRVKGALVIASNQRAKDAEARRKQADEEYARAERERIAAADPEERARAEQVKSQIRDFLGGNA